MKKTLVTIFFVVMTGWISANTQAYPLDDWEFSTGSTAQSLEGEVGDVVVDDDDVVHFCYTDSSYYLIYASYSDGTWTFETIQSSVVSGCSIDVDSDNEPHVTFCDSSLYHAYRSGGSWTIENPDNAVDCQYLPIANHDIYVDSADDVHVSYYDSANGDLKYAGRDSSTGTWTSTTVDNSSNDVGTISSIAAHGATPLYIAYHDADNYDLKLATYDGTSWSTETVTAVTGSMATYPAAAVDTDDTLHLAFGYDLEYSSQDAYGNWSNEALTAEDTGFGIDIAVDDFNNIYIAYINSDLNDIKIITNSLLDSYGAWTDVTLDDTIGSARLYEAQIDVDSYGKMHVLYYDNNLDQLVYAHNDAGDTQNIANNSGNSSAVSSGDGGAVYASTYNDFNADLTFYEFDGETWNGAVVDSSGDVGAYNSLTVSAAGTKYITYYDNTNGDLKLAQQSSGGSSWSTSTIDNSTSADIGQYNSVAVSGTALYVSYYDDVNDNLMHATNVSGAWVKTTVDATNDVGSFSSIAVGDTGRIHICYYDATNLRLRYAYKDFGSPWKKRAIGSDQGVYCDITTDPNDGDVAWISYYDADTADKNLVFVRVTATSTAFTTVDSSDDVGRYTSITTDEFSRPLISYYEATNGDLKLARRDSLGVWDVKTLSESGDIGRNTSITMDSFQHAHIIHQDYSGGRLMHTYY